MTEQEILEIIDRVARKQSTKPHGIYSVEDLQQFSRMVCWTKLHQFDFSRGKTKDIPKALENWLSKVVKNRLVNLHRDTSKEFDKPFKNDINECQLQIRNNLLRPLSLEILSESDAAKEYDFDNVHTLRNITRHLDDEHIEILDCYLSGFAIPAYYRNKLLKKIKVIVSNLNE